MRKKLLPISIVCNIILVFAFLFLIRSLGGWNYFLYKVQNRGLTGMYQHRKELLDKLKVEPTDIIFLGNSLTAEGEWSELLQHPDIKNRGIAGDGVTGVLDRLNNILEGKPRAIYLMIGVNDLYYHKPSYVLKQYDSILQQCKNKIPKTDVILQSILPVNNEVKNTRIDNKDILTTNEGIKQLAADYGLRYIDLHPSFQNSRGQLKAEFTVDGIHLNGDGYLLWRDLLLTSFTY